MMMSQTDRNCVDELGPSSTRGRKIERLQVGAHLVEIEQPDTFVVRFSGDVDGGDVSQVLDVFEGFATGRGRAYLLVDLSGLGQVTPEARRVSGMRQLPPEYAGLSLFGGTFEQQLVAKLATMAGWLLRGRYLGKPMPVCMKLEREARAWVAAQKAQS